MSTLVKSLFTIDDDIVVEGYHDPSIRWNGFATPIFKREAIEEWCVKTAEAEAVLGFEPLQYRYHPTDKQFEVLCGGCSEDEWDLYDAEEVSLEEGEFYPVGAFCWCWMELE